MARAWLLPPQSPQASPWIADVCDLQKQTLGDAPCGIWDAELQIDWAHLSEKAHEETFPDGPAAVFFRTCGKSRLWFGVQHKVTTPPPPTTVTRWKRTAEMEESKMEDCQTAESECR